MTEPPPLTIEESNDLFMKLPCRAPRPNTPQPPSAPPGGLASNGTLQVRLASTQADLDGVLAVRNQVFFSDLGMPRTWQIDSCDTTAAHFVLFDAAKPDAVLGTVRLTPLPAPARLVYPVVDYDRSQPLGLVKGDRKLATIFSERFATSSPETPTGVGAILSRLCVYSSVRGAGGGKALILAAERWLADILRVAPEAQQRSTTIVLRSVANKVGLYERCVSTGPALPVVCAD